MTAKAAVTRIVGDHNVSRGLMYILQISYLFTIHTVLHLVFVVPSLSLTVGHVWSRAVFFDLDLLFLSLGLKKPSCLPLVSFHDTQNHKELQYRLYVPST